MKIYKKTFGVVEGFHKGVRRYFVKVDCRRTDLHYATPKTALKMAESFCKSCHRDFTNFTGEAVHFVFEEEEKEDIKEDSFEGVAYRYGCLRESINQLIEKGGEKRA